MILPRRVYICGLQVARESDLGSNNNVFLCRTHLGRFLQAGDIVLGYDLARFVTTDDNLEQCVRNGYQVPDVVLVKKCFDDVRAKRRTQHRPRNYKLRHLAKEVEDGNVHSKRMQAAEAERREEMEQFMNVRAPPGDNASEVKFRATAPFRHLRTNAGA
jgi:nonsense-mediated mRNA decay protein 3